MKYDTSNNVKNLHLINWQILKHMLKKYPESSPDVAAQREITKSLYDQILHERNIKNYPKYSKSKCANKECQKRFKKTFENWVMNGNTCPVCSRKYNLYYL